MNVKFLARVGKLNNKVGNFTSISIPFSLLLASDIILMMSMTFTSLVPTLFNNRTLILKILEPKILCKKSKRKVKAKIDNKQTIKYYNMLLPVKTRR